jgi:hypothetical protein
MLTANALVGAVIAVALGTDPSRFSNRLILFVGCGFGLVLSLLWRSLTIEGWRISKAWCQELMKIKVGGSSVLDPYFAWHQVAKKGSSTDVLTGAKRDAIETKALRVINLFVCAYAMGVIVTGGFFVWRWLSK